MNRMRLPRLGLHDARDAAEAWPQINAAAVTLAIRVGAAAAVVDAVLYIIDRNPMWAGLAGVALLASLTAIIENRRPRPDIARVMFVTIVGLAGVAPFMPPLVGGVLMLSPIAFGGIAGIILTTAMYRATVWVIVVILLSQLTWPLFGAATVREAIAAFIIETVVAVMALTVVTIARRSMARSEAVRINLFQRVPVGLFRVHRDGRFIDANPALVSMLGYGSVADLIGHNVSDVVPDDAYRRSLLHRLDESGEAERIAVRMRRADGVLIWARGYCKAVSDRRGSVTFYEGAVEDITQRRLAEAASRVSEERFRNVFTRSPIALWEEDFSAVGTALETIRSTGVRNIARYLEQRPEEAARLISLVRFTDVNPAGVAMVGAPNREYLLSGIDPEAVDEPVVASFTKQFEAIWNAQPTATIETQGTRADGSKFDCVVHWAAPSDGSKLALERVVVAIVDVTRQKQIESELNSLITSKDDLIASVSHELRTPITSVMGLAHELRDNSAHFEHDEFTELIGIIADQSRELANIVEDLLVAARDESDSMLIRPESVDLSRELQSVAVTSDAEWAGAFEVSASPPVWADPLRLRQILRNLLSNAARYGGDDVRITAEVADGLVRIVVSDDGPGIPVEDRESIFLPYRRAQKITGLPASLGLGLAVSRRLARLMNGDLVYEHDGRSNFTLSLPVAPSSSESAA